MKLEAKGHFNNFLAYSIPLSQQWKTTKLKKPKFVDMFYAVPHNKEIHFVKLEDIEEPVLVFDLEAYAFISLLDGNQTLEKAWKQHCQNYPQSDWDTAVEIMAKLQQMHLLMEGASASPSVNFESDYMERQERQIRFLAHFETDDMDRWEYQRRVRDARILILGAGGTGSQALLLLAAAGFLNITIVDFDKVELSNLNRQLIYLQKDVGQIKVEAAKQRIEGFNSSVKITALREKLDNHKRLVELMSKADICLCCADVPPILLRDTINTAGLDSNVPVIYGGIYADHVNIGPLVVPGKTGCFRCWNENRAQRNPDYRHYFNYIINQEKETGTSACNVWLYGTTGCGIAMGMGGVVMDIIRFISGCAPVRTLGYQFKMNFCTFEIEKLEWPRIETCPACGTSQ